MWHDLGRSRKRREKVYLKPSHRVQLSPSESEKSSLEMSRAAFLRARLVRLCCCGAGAWRLLPYVSAASRLLAVSAASLVVPTSGTRVLEEGMTRETAAGHRARPF